MWSKFAGSKTATGAVGTEISLYAKVLLLLHTVHINKAPQ